MILVLSLWSVPLLCRVLPSLPFVPFILLARLLREWIWYMVVFECFFLFMGQIQTQKKIISKCARIESGTVVLCTVYNHTNCKALENNIEY